LVSCLGFQYIFLNMGRNVWLSSLFVIVLCNLLIQWTGAQSGCQSASECQNVPQLPKIPPAPIDACLCESCPCNDEFQPMPSHVLNGLHKRHHHKRAPEQEFSEENTDVKQEYEEAKKSQRKESCS